MNRKDDLMQFFISANTAQDYQDFNLDVFVKEYIKQNPKKPKKVYLVKDNNKSLIYGCFYKKDKAIKYCANSRSVHIEKIKVI